MASTLKLVSAVLATMILSSCFKELYIPAINDARVHGVALEATWNGFLSSTSLISNNNCDKTCLTISDLKQKNFGGYSQSRFNIQFLKFSEKFLSESNIIIKQSEFNDELALIKYFLPILLSKYEDIYSSAKTKVQVNIHFLPNSSFLDNLKVREVRQGLIIYHFAYYTNAFIVNRQKLIKDRKLGRKNKITYTAISVASLAHELSHIAQFDINQERQNQHLNIINNEARAKMFEIYCLGSFFAKYRQDFNVGYSVELNIKGINQTSNGNISLIGKDSINYNGITPFEKGYMLGVRQVIKVIKSNKIQAGDSVGLDIIRGYLKLNLIQNIDLTKD